MAYRFFKIAAHGMGDEVRELNAFMRSQRVLRVEKEWCADGAEWYRKAAAQGSAFA